MEYAVGDVVSGTVSGVVDYGAFVRLADGSSGMIHISKLSRSFVADINSVIKKGDEVTATVISVNGAKLGLSLVGIPDESRSARPPKKDFESMLSSFKSASDEKMASLVKSQRGENRDRRRRDK